MPHKNLHFPFIYAKWDSYSQTIIMVRLSLLFSAFFYFLISSDVSRCRFISFQTIHYFNGDYIRINCKSRFDIIKKLGQGTYGKVQLGINKETSQEVAIKTIKKCKIETEADLVRIRREVQIMSSVQHPNIIHIYEGICFSNSSRNALELNYCLLALLR